MPLRLADRRTRSPTTTSPRNASRARSTARTVAFTPVDELPVDTAIVITIGPGRPVGRRAADEPTVVETYTGRTFGSLRVERHELRLRRRVCTRHAVRDRVLQSARPGDVRGRPDRRRAGHPRPPHRRVRHRRSSSAARTEGHTDYEVTLDGTLTDVFGQTLGDDATVDFDVGSADPASAASTRLHHDRPGGRLAVGGVTTINHDSIRVRAWAVTPADARRVPRVPRRAAGGRGRVDPRVAGGARRRRSRSTPRPTSTSRPPSTSPTRSTPRPVELVVRVDPTCETSPNDEAYWRNRPTIAWVQNTTLGIDAFLDDDNLVICTTDLATGEPIGGVPVELIGDGRVATTDDDGLAELELGDDGILGLWAQRRRPHRVPARPTCGTAGASTQVTEVRWYVFDDRGIYRPGDTARLTGLGSASSTGREDAASARTWSKATSVSYTRPRRTGDRVRRRHHRPEPARRFQPRLELPDGANLGQACGRVPDLRGRLTTVRLRPAHRSGPGVPSARVRGDRPQPRPRRRTSSPSRRPSPSTPSTSRVARCPTPMSTGSSPRARPPTPRPNWDDYTFGIWQPWWCYDGGGDVDDVRASATSPSAARASTAGRVRRGRVRGVRRTHRCRRLPLPPDRLRRGRRRPADHGHRRGDRLRRQPPGVGVRTDLLVHPAQLLRRAAHRPQLRRARERRCASTRS